MNSVSHHQGGRVPQVLAGPSSIERLAALDAMFGSRAAVLVVDEAVVATGYVDRVSDVLSGLDQLRVHVVPPREPTAASVDEAAAAVRSAGGATVIGIGGGTALDTAKQAALVAGGVDGVEHYALGAHPFPSGRPIVAIPTTAGTGAEVTRTCVLTDRAGRKVWTWGDGLLPALVVLDPVASATMPPHVTAATGLDAFVHAVESVSGRRTNALVAAPALHAIRLVLEHLPAAVADGTDLDVRGAMQEAALLAGVAIDGGGTGIAHSIGHALGSRALANGAHVPHGVAVAVGLAAAMAWNVGGTPEAFASIGSTLGRPVHRLVDVYTDLLIAARFPHVVGRLGELAVPADELAAAMVAEENRPMFDNNCRRADDRDRLALAASTLRTWDDLRNAA